jgi:hypothetical protein
MLKDPIKQAKELSNDKRSNEKLELFQNIFDMIVRSLSLRSGSFLSILSIVSDWIVIAFSRNALIFETY